MLDVDVFDRLSRITRCMNELEFIRGWYGKSEAELATKGFWVMGLELGEMDQLTELHRLLYEYNQ